MAIMWAGSVAISLRGVKVTAIRGRRLEMREWTMRDQRVHSKTFPGNLGLFMSCVLDYQL